MHVFVCMFVCVGVFPAAYELSGFFLISAITLPIGCAYDVQTHRVPYTISL